MVELDKILVVGGGIVGMSSAITLAKAGWAVELVERDPDWRALGAGLTVLGSTLRALAALDVADPVLKAGYFRRTNNIYRYTGELLLERPAMTMPDSDLPGAGGILRPVLHGILAAKVRECGVTVRIGLSYRSMEQDAGGVDVVFTDGSSGRYDLVVAAEGLHSNLRSILFPDAPKPRYTGQGCWRLVAPRPAEIDRSSFYVGGPVTVGTVPVSNEQMYVWILEHAPDNPWVEPATQHQQLRQLLSEFGGAVAQLRDDIGADSMIVYRPLEAILVPSPWHQGRILLTGDAAHATTPHLASGAGAGVEDAIVLAQELMKANALDDALKAHVQRRFERCRLVVESSLEIGRVEMAHQSERINDLMNVAQAAIAQPF